MWKFAGAVLVGLLVIAGPKVMAEEVSLSFTGDCTLQAGKGGSGLLAKEGEVRLVLGEGVETKADPAVPEATAIYFCGKQVKPSQLSRSLTASQPTSVILRIHPTGGEERNQTILTLGCCELRYDMQKEVLSFITYFDKGYAIVKKPCPKNAWSTVEAKLADNSLSLTVNGVSGSKPFPEGKSLKTRKVTPRIGAQGKDNRLFVGYLNDLVLTLNTPAGE